LKPYPIQPGDPNCAHAVKYDIKKNRTIEGVYCNVFRCRACGAKFGYPVVQEPMWVKQQRKTRKKKKGGEK